MTVLGRHLDDYISELFLATKQQRGLLGGKEIGWSDDDLSFLLVVRSSSSSSSVVRPGWAGAALTPVQAVQCVGRRSTGDGSAESESGIAEMVIQSTQTGHLRVE